VIGPRHGEKHFETLLSREEMAVAEDGGDHFRVPPDNRSLNYDAYESAGKLRVSGIDDYNSQNARLLDVPEMAEILARLPYVQAFLCGAQPDAI
jgi:UDP-glucose 4-epimerase